MRRSAPLMPPNEILTRFAPKGYYGFSRSTERMVRTLAIDGGVKVLTRGPFSSPMPDYALWQGDVETFLDLLPKRQLFDLVVTSPPYNLGKPYEERVDIETYVAWQKRIIEKIYPFVKDFGSICWEVGNFVENGKIIPLDIELAPVFKALEMPMRNRIVWKFGHGMHCKRRFSGRYEVVLWYTKKEEDYVFNLDDVRIQSKYPGKRHFRGPKKGEYSGNPKGKNPEDVWDIPNVKSNHIEKTSHPCQFPVGLVERLVLALTNKGGLIFDPFAGVGSAGVAAAIHGRRFWGAEIMPDYVTVSKTRIEEAIAGRAKYRPHDKPIYDHTLSSLSRRDDSMHVTPLEDLIVNGDR
jgi:adenine-specific DNA-methyltransferase